MKTVNALRNLLGITQQDMSLLLQVNRSQWSMFELGKRDLPLPAKTLLAELLTYIQSAPTTQKEHSDLMTNALQKELEQRLRENEYQQLRIAKKIAVLEKKHKIELRAWQLKEFIEIQQQKNNNKTALMLNALALRTKTAKPAQSFIVLKQQQHKQELLALEQFLLESKLKKIMLRED